MPLRRPHELLVFACAIALSASSSKGTYVRMNVFLCGVESHDVSGTARSTDYGTQLLISLIKSGGASAWDRVEVWEIEEQLKADAHHLRTAALPCLTSDQVRGVDSTLEHNQWPRSSRPGWLTRASRSGSIALPPEEARTQLARVINNLGVLFLTAGTYDDALTALRQGESIFREALPTENRNLGGLLSNIAGACLSQERMLEGRPSLWGDKWRAQADRCMQEARSLGYP